MILTNCLSDTSVNVIWGDSSGNICCPEFTCRLYLSPGEPVREITRIDKLGGVECPVEILEINGIPYTNPLGTHIFLTTSNYVEIRMSICPCGGTFPTDTFDSGIEVHYVGGTPQQFRWDFEIVDIGDPSFTDRKSTRLNSSHVSESRMPSSA